MSEVAADETLLVERAEGLVLVTMNDAAEALRTRAAKELLNHARDVDRDTRLAWGAMAQRAGGWREAARPSPGLEKGGQRGRGTGGGARTEGR